jgi:hypothetical protein
MMTMLQVRCPRPRGAGKSRVIPWRRQQQSPAFTARFLDASYARRLGGLRGNCNGQLRWLVGLNLTAPVFLSNEGKTEDPALAPFGSAAKTGRR